MCDKITYINELAANTKKLIVYDNIYRYKSNLW